MIATWHAHVYFDASTRAAALALRVAVTAAFAERVTMGRFHEQPVGPHPMWSYQVGVPASAFTDVIGWLALNHGALDVFVHPNTDDERRDHRDSALWIGRSHVLDLSAFD